MFHSRGFAASLALFLLLVFAIRSPLASVQAGGVKPDVLLGGDCASVTFATDPFGGPPDTAHARVGGVSIGSVDITTASTIYTITFATPQAEGTLINITPGTLSYSCTTPLTSASVSLDPLGDADGDGILNAADNCPTTANPSQENGWGGRLGDACDSDFYDGGVGAKAFVQSSGQVHIYGNCQGTRCAIIAILGAGDLSEILTPPDFRRFDHPDGGGWYVDVYFLGTRSDGVKVYQVNIYAADGRLIDDRLLLFIFPDGRISQARR
jgi:hypothetical protein